jgi:hypothetical protein
MGAISGHSDVPRLAIGEDPIGRADLLVVGIIGIPPVGTCRRSLPDKGPNSSTMTAWGAHAATKAFMSALF